VADCVIEHDCVIPVVRVHFAVFVANGDFVSCTITQRAAAHRNLFFPWPVAIWTTFRACVHAHPLPGQLGPA
jgi:hypothetical protein